MSIQEPSNDTGAGFIASGLSRGPLGGGDSDGGITTIFVQFCRPYHSIKV